MMGENRHTEVYMDRFCFPPSQKLGQISQIYNPKVKLNFAEISKIFEAKETQKGLIKAVLVSILMSVIVSVILNKFAGTIIITFILIFFTALGAASYFIFSRIKMLRKEITEYDMSSFDKERIQKVEGQLWITLYIIAGFSLISFFTLLCLRKRISMSAKMIKVNFSFKIISRLQPNF